MNVTVGGLVWILKSQAGPAVVEHLRQELTIERRTYKDFDDGSQKIVKLYGETDHHIGVPRQFWAATSTVDHEYDWSRVSFGSPIETESKIRHTGPYAEQARAVGMFVDKFRYAETSIREGGVNPVHVLRAMGGILLAKPGFGKCLGIGTEVLKYNGEIVRVEDVREGDLLMGPDSRPRRVLSTCRGVGPLYEIQPVKGDSWVCNDGHVLTTVYSGTGVVSDTPLKEFFKKDKTFQKRSKLFQPDGGVDFDGDDIELTIDPYFMGIWLGDGNKDLNSVSVCKWDKEILLACEDVARKWGLCVSKYAYGGKCPRYAIVLPKSKRGGRRNPLLEEMRRLFRGGIRVPRHYLTASRGVRYEILAGLLDTDGYLSRGCFEIVTKYKGLADDVSFLSRSLGFRVTTRDKIVDGYAYKRLLISGPVNEIPTRIERRIAAPRRQIKNALRTGFSAEHIGDGEYYGFTLDGDGRFLLGDFTVTHNTQTALEVIHRVGRTAMVLVNKEFLMRQWAERIENFLPGARVGIIQESTCDFEDRDIVIAMVHSLALDDMMGGRYPKGIYQFPGILVVDEVHRIASDSWSPLPQRFAAAYRLGLSATPRRKDGTDRVFFDHIGPITYTAKTQMETAGVRVTRFDGKFPTFLHDPETRAVTVVTNLCKSRPRNGAIVREVVGALNAPGGRKVMVLSHRLEQLESIEEMIQASKDCPADLTIGHYVGQWFAPGDVAVLRPGHWDMNKTGRKKAISAIYSSLSRRKGGVGRIEKTKWVDPWTDEEVEGKGHIVVIPETGEESILEALSDDDLFSIAENYDIRQERKRRMIGVKEEELTEAARARLLLVTFQMCVDADEKFRDPVTGEDVTIREAVKGRDLNVITGRGGFSIVRPRSAWLSGRKMCVRVVTASGRSRTVTRDHRMWTPRGWVEASELTSGMAREPADHLAFPGKLDVDWKPSGISSGEAWLMGLLIADGSLSQPESGTFGFTTDDRTLVEEANSILRGNKTWLRRFVERFGLARVAHEKRVPLAVMFDSPGIIASFVAGYFDGDGCIDSRGVISFDSVSSELLEQVRTLLLRLGIPVLSELKNCKGCWRLPLPRWVSKRFLDVIPSRLPRKIDRVCSRETRRLGLGIGNSVPPKYVQQLREAIRRDGHVLSDAIEWCESEGHSAIALLHKHGEMTRDAYRIIADRLSFGGEYREDIVWDRVVDVIDVGERDVGDLVVEPDHSWCFGGAIVHNCEEGLDVPPVDTIVLASPHGDVAQAVGRGRRFCVPVAEGGTMTPEKCEHFCPWRAEGCKGKKPLVVVDVVDAAIPVSEKRFKWRTAHYQEEGYRVSFARRT